MLDLIVLNGMLAHLCVKNLMINDVKWLKWIDEYITLAMNVEWPIYMSADVLCPDKKFYSQ